MNQQQSVQFNSEEGDYLRQNKRRAGLVGLVMRLSGGRVQNERVANYWLLAFALAVFIAAFLIFTSFV